ncbi:MAG: Fic family protein [Lachnospiraceae bacterium]|nr:Fic family protein [Lachnospiraceae bacterium]
MNNRAGTFIDTGLGYKTFLPCSLPPNPGILIDTEMQQLLSLADRKLGRLDGITQVIPNPNLFVAMYVRKEAVLSSQIEGTQASFVDVLGAEYNLANDQQRDDIGEISNYVHAMNWGLSELENLPLSLRLIRSIHQKLLSGTRGDSRNPGEFRQSQNWIGPAGCTLKTATFVPPSVPDMKDALGDLEKYFYKEDGLPALIKIALIHAQFESIHPFLDGNGRIGRLLITFWLCQQQILSKPLLYLSYYFKQHRSDYYDLLMKVRKEGAWEDWIKFFLKGVASVSDEAVNTAKSIITLKDSLSSSISNLDSKNSYYRILLDHLFDVPFVTRSEVVQILSVSNPTAGSIIDTFVDLGILQDVSPDRKRNKLYKFSKYIDILQEGTEI